MLAQFNISDKSNLCYSVTETVASNLTANDTFFEVSNYLTQRIILLATYVTMMLFAFRIPLQ